ncbi:MAG: tyrosine-type recombinase/integrase [Patescibacteria group bacterium]
MNNNKSLIEYILDFYKYCKDERDFSDKTIENYGRYLDRFISWLKTSNLTHLTPQHLSINTIDQYNGYLSAHKIKPITVNYYLIAIRVFIQYLSEKNIPCPVSFQKIKLPKKEKNNTKSILTTVQLEELLQQPNTSHNIGLRDRVILEIITSTGLKITELSTLNKNNIRVDNFTNRAIIDIFGREGNNRTVCVPSKTTEWLLKYLDNRKDDDKALFINYRSRKENDQSPIRLTVRSIERMVEKYGNLIDFSDPITPESLRNAYIKGILENEPNEIKIIHNHRDITTKEYSLDLNVKTKTSLITEWHRKMMSATANYFKKTGHSTFLEPALNMGRADIGISSKSSGPPMYIEIGTTSVYKLLYNLLTTKDSIFLIIPAEEYIIELKT